MVLQRLTSLFKRPEPAGPPEVLRTFTTSDALLTRDGVTVDGEAWRIEFNEGRSVRLFEETEPRVDQCILTYRARVRTEGTQGRVYLEMWCRLPGRGEFFSKGFQQAVKGTTDWSNHETPFLLKAGQQPDLVKLNLVCEGAGTVWIKDMELLRTPLK